MCAPQMQLNQDKWGLFDQVPTSLRHLIVNGRKLAPSSIAIGSKIFGLSKGKRGVCYLSYAQLGEEYGYSESTIWRALERLFDGEIIERGERTNAGCSFRFKKTLDSKEYYVTPTYLRTLTVKIDGVVRTLRPSEIAILSYIMRKAMPQEVFTFLQDKTKTPQAKSKKMKETKFQCRGSVREICRALNLHPNTVIRALKALSDAYFIIVPINEIGKNCYKKTLYEIVHKEVYDYLLHRKLPKPAKVGAAEQAANAQVAAANARADRERWYAKRREKAISPAEKWKEKANKDPAYKRATAELAKMEFKLAKAEMYYPDKLPSLQAKQAQLRAEQAQRLKVMKISPEWMLPAYSCKKCEDTGFLPSGIACDCYRPRE